MISPRVSSATASAFAPGTLQTSIPSDRARSTSIVLMPAPARTTSFSESAASSAAAVIRVLRTMSASNPGKGAGEVIAGERRHELALVAFGTKLFELLLRERVGNQDVHRVGSNFGTPFSTTLADVRFRRNDIADTRSVIPAPAGVPSRWFRTPVDQNASASISMTESAPALRVASSEAVLGRRRRTKNLAVASFAR